MTRISSDLSLILLKIVDRIRSEVPEFSNEGTCFLSLNPDECPPSPGDKVCIVAPTSGKFDEAYFDGGGAEQATVNSGFIVKIHSPLLLDDYQRDAEFLTNESLGVLKSAKLVLAALAEFSPQDDGENDLVRDLISPSSFTITKSNKRLGAIELDFNLVIDWDATISADD